MPAESPYPRRSFVNWILGTGVGSVVMAVVYPIARFISPPEIPEAQTSRVLAGKVSELAHEGWTIFQFGNDPGILVKVAEGEYRALSATCTHLDCTVQYRKDLKAIW